MKELKTDCKTCTNLGCLIKKHVDSPQIEKYLERKHSIFCRSSQQFILEGSPVYGLYFIYEGVVKVMKTSSNSKEQIIRLSSNGEIVGHRGFGTDYVYNVSAVALQDAVLCNFTSSDLKEMLHEIPELMYDFMVFYADQLQRSETNAKRFGQMTVREKVMNALLLIWTKFGNTEGYMNLQLSRKEIADFAGTTEEQVIKNISALKKENLLRAQGKKLGIIDETAFSSAISQDNRILPS